MRQTIEQWLLAEGLSAAGINMGLERVSKARDYLKLNPTMPIITVGGTNGKGSVCAMLSTILTEAGFRVGCYTSPQMERFNDRVKINNIPLDDQQIIPELEKLLDLRKKFSIPLSYFELVTLACVNALVSQKCDILILEVGLGGRLDAVNIFDADVAIITQIDLDHCDILGKTRAAISLEKGAISRRGRPIIIGDENPPPELLADLEKRQAKAYFLHQQFKIEKNSGGWCYQGIKQQNINFAPPALLGAHQIKNAACALAALEVLPHNFHPGRGAIRKGLQTVDLPWRLQVLPQRPITVLDVAHNTAAAIALEKFLFDMGYFPYTRAVFGMLPRKDIETFIRHLNPRIDEWYIAPLEAEDNTAAITNIINATGKKCRLYPSIAKAGAAAQQDSNSSDRIVITGSFLTVSYYVQSNQKQS